MDCLQDMEKMLIDYVYKKMVSLENINTNELGEAIDMIKDLAEAIYYRSITK